MKKLLLLVMAVVLVGCGTTNFQKPEIDDFVAQNNSNLLKMKIGMTKEEVLKLMASGKTEDRFPSYAKSEKGRFNGEPKTSETYQTKDGKTLEFWMYYTKSGGGGTFNFNTGVVTSAPDTTDKNFTPVCFIDGKVQGWGRNFFDDTIKIRKEIIKNP